jgi:hypothetical protein
MAPIFRCISSAELNSGHPAGFSNRTVPILPSNLTLTNLQQRKNTGRIKKMVFTERFEMKRHYLQADPSMDGV